MHYVKPKNCPLVCLILGLLAVSLLHSNAVSASLAQDKAAPNPHSKFHSIPHPKPSSPIDVRIQPVTELVPGQLNEFKLTVSTKINVANVVAKVELPVGWKVQSGSPNWQGGLSQGQDMVLRFSVMIPATGQFTLVARATMGDDGSGQFSAVNSYSIGQSAKLKAVNTQRYRFAARDGQPLVQYKIP